MSTVRDEVLAIIACQVANENLRRHMLATEAIMRALAARLSADAEAWGLAGLAHDADVEQTESDFSRHGLLAAEMLRERNVSDDVAHAVAAHNAETGEIADTPLAVALIAADQLSGLITAAVLVRPDAALAGAQVKSLRKRFRESAFARGVDRDAIRRCEELGLELEEFLALGLEAMQGIAKPLGFE